MALINPPFFAVSTPQAFHDLDRIRQEGAGGDEDFHPGKSEIAAFAGWAKTAPWTASYPEEPYHGLNSFIFTDAKGEEHAVRWSLLPTVQPGLVSQAELEKRGPDFLEQERGAGPDRRPATLDW